MTIIEKIKTIDNKIKQNKAQFDLDRQIPNISALSSRNVSKYEFLMAKMFFTRKDLLEKAAAVKRLEYSPLDSELKKQTDIDKKQHQRLDKLYDFDETINENDKKPTLKKYNKSDLIYNSNIIMILSWY